MMPFNPALSFLAALLGARMERARREEGASVVEWVVIAAIVVTLTIAIGAVLVAALTSKANDVGNQIQGS